MNTDPKRISRYHRQAFWFLLTALSLSLGYELYRVIAKAGVSSYDTFNPALLLFYLMGFGMAALIRSNRRWAWWLVLLFTLVLIAMGTFYYDPIVLLARHPDLIDWCESGAYLGLLWVIAFLSVQQLRGRILLPEEHSFS